MDKQHYTATEVAAIMGMHLTTVYRYAHLHFLPSIKIGATYRFPRHQIDQLANQEIKAYTNAESATKSWRNK